MNINKIRFSNYKAFKFPQELDIHPLTVIIGKNSSGKSIVSRLPLLLINSLRNNSDFPLLLDDNNIDFGVNFSDLIYLKNQSKDIKLGFSFLIGEDNYDIDFSLQQFFFSFENTPIIIMSWIYKINNEIVIELEYDTNSSDSETKSVIYSSKVKFVGNVIVKFKGLLPSEIIDFSNGSTLFNEEINKFTKIFKDDMQKINYFGPFRDLPKRIYKQIDINNNDSSFWFSKFYPYILANNKKTNNLQFIENISQWFQKNLGNWAVDIHDYENKFFEIVLVSPENKNVKVNIFDVGNGMGQVLPLVISCFFNRLENELDIIEQPELHLHPACHANLAELFAQSMIKNKIKYIIETHSENFILRLRRLIVENKIPSKDIGIYWVNDSESEGSLLKKITINNEGELDYWPEGVFSEDYYELIAIRKALKGITQNDSNN